MTSLKPASTSEIVNISVSVQRMNLSLAKEKFQELFSFYRMGIVTPISVHGLITQCFVFVLI